MIIVDSIDMGITANTPFASPTQNSGSGSGGSGHRFSSVNVFEVSNIIADDYSSADL
jgi:hypothetical protein